MRDISVIIPLYNAEKWVEQTLHSLLNQSIIERMTIIVVDDHGSDSSRQIVENVRDTHPNGAHIEIIETPLNSGAWAARNLGLDYAQTDWVAFCDADDYCGELMYEKLLAAAQRGGAQWAYCKGVRIEKGKKDIPLEYIPIEDFDHNKRKEMLTKGVAYFWTGLYSRIFLNVNKIRFPKSKFSEDSYFWWLCVMCTQKITSVDYVGYYYRIQPQSVSRIADNKKAQTKHDIFVALLDDLKERGLYDYYKQELDYLSLKKGGLIPCFITAITNKSVTKREYLNLLKGIDYKRNRYYKQSLLTRVITLFFAHTPKLIAPLIRLFYKTDPF